MIISRERLSKDHLQKPAMKLLPESFMFPLWVFCSFTEVFRTWRDCGASLTFVDEREIEEFCGNSQRGEEGRPLGRSSSLGLTAAVFRVSSSSHLVEKQQPCELRAA